MFAVGVRLLGGDADAQQLAKFADNSRRAEMQHRIGDSFISKACFLCFILVWDR